MKESVRSQTFALLQDTTCCFLEDQRYGKSTFRGPLMGPGPGRTPSICSFSTETSKCGARGGRSGALAWVRIQPWCQKLQILGTRAAVMEPWAGSKSSPIQPWCRKLQILGTKDGTPSTCSTLVFSPIPGLVLIPDCAALGQHPLRANLGLRQLFLLAQQPLRLSFHQYPQE